MDKTNLEKPDETKVAAIRQALEKLEGIWGATSGLNLLTRKLRVTRLPLLIREMVNKEIESVQLDLGYPDAPPLERLLIENVASFWVHLHLTQLEYAALSGQGVPVETADRWERRLSAAQRRFLKAIETLARVRRLRRSASLQLNIGAQQLNVTAEVNPLSAPAGPEPIRSSPSANPPRLSEGQTSRPLKPSEARDAQAVTSKRNRQQRSK